MSELRFDGKVVVVTEVTDANSSSKWPDAVCVGIVTEHVRNVCADTGNDMTFFKYLFKSFNIYKFLANSNFRQT